MLTSARVLESTVIEFDDVTVGIPLHRSRPWVDVVAGNLERLAGTAHVVVSDATEDDDALATLRDRFGAAPGVIWVGARPGIHGWVDHCNDLVQRSSTDLFMWLPHDDEIGPEYLRECRRVLLADPTLGAAVGRTESIDGPGLDDRPQPSLADVLDDRHCRLVANDCLARWSLGMLFHAVVRRAANRPLARTTGAGDWADMVWAYGICLEWTVGEVPEAVYRKRFYADSTSARWSTDFYPWGLPHLVREIRTRVAASEQAAAVDELVDVFTALVGEVVTERTVRAQGLQDHLDWVLHSRSYRVAQALRTLRDRTVRS